MRPAYSDGWATVYAADALEGAKLLEPRSVHAIVTSPPYWGLRSYLPEDDPNKALELGTEPGPELYVERLVEIFRALKPALRDDGTLWLNIGDSYAVVRGNGGNPPDSPWAGFVGNPHREAAAKTVARKVPKDCKPKDLIGVPWMVAFALRADGWYLRRDVIWSKPNPMPESVTDRPTSAHEYVFLFSKSPRYFFDQEAAREPATEIHRRPNVRQQESNPVYEVPGQEAQHLNAKDNGRHSTGRNIRSVWTIATKPYPGSHYACVDEETQVLTREGFKSHDELTTTDEVATLDTLRERIRYHNPYAIHRYSFAGEMVRIENGWIDQLVTPNHRVLLKYVHSTTNKTPDAEWGYARADGLRPHSGILVPNGGDYDGPHSVSEHRAALLGWIITEGSVPKDGRRINIYQSASANPSKTEALQKIIEAAGVRATRSERRRPYAKADGSVVESHEVVFRLSRKSQNIEWVFDWIKHDKTPKWALLHLRRCELIALFEALIDGDGHRRADGRVSFVQNSADTHEWFRTLCCHLGLRTTQHRHTRVHGGMTTHVTNQNYSQIHQSDFAEVVRCERYVGTVWCPEVPNTNFVARRKGKIYVTGNTFPPDLVYPCVKAGTSERGVCEACGAPRERVVENQRGDSEAANRPKHLQSAKSTLSLSGHGGKGWTERGAKSRAVGWEPTCRCDAETVPATILDPFVGSGTTLWAARKLGRKSVGFDLDARNMGLIEERMGDQGVLL